MRQHILDAYGSRQRLFVLTNEEVRRYITRLTDQWFGLTYVQIAVAVLVAVLGIVNALTVSITDRRRELGVLQAVGGLRRVFRPNAYENHKSRADCRHPYAVDVDTGRLHTLKQTNHGAIYATAPG